MSQRSNILEQEPGTVRAMHGLEQFVKKAGIDPILLELVRIRASQLNGCAYCIDLHTREARSHGETEQRIYLLNAWRDAGTVYTEAERIALALTEEMTLIADGGVRDETYEKVIQHFEPSVVAGLIMAIVTINAWNRISVTLQIEPKKEMAVVG